MIRNKLFCFVKETEDPGSNHENGSNAEKSNDEDAEKDNDEEEDVAAKESDDSDSDRTLEKKVYFILI